MTVSSPYLECSNEPGGPWGGNELTGLLTLPLPLQPQRVCCAEAHRHQQEVLHQLQAVVPEENLWQINVSICNHPRPAATKEAGFCVCPLQVPSDLGQPSGRSGCLRSREDACANMSGSRGLGSGSFSTPASFVLTRLGSTFQG